jgi:HSP20 family protein
MNTMMKWNPFKEMDELQNRLSTYLGRTPGRTDGGTRESLTVSEWTPLVDITEDPKEYVIKVELPEVKKEELKVNVENGVLSITGERKFEKEEKGKKFHRIERSYGSFIRTFTVPDDVDAGKVVAEFKEGVLCVHLPKDEKAKPRTLDIKVQ